MQHNIVKHGFSYCGIIYLASGDERLAYQRINYSYTLFFCKLLTLAPHFTKLTHSDSKYLFLMQKYKL